MISWGITPAAIRTDNGAPFSSPSAFYGMSRLSVWWLRLGIEIERIKPGNPQQNGRHERMNLKLKKETTKPASYNFLQQQARFDAFQEEYNHDRPHESLGMKYPGEPEYPYHDKTLRVTNCGRICMGRRKTNLSQAFAGQMVGIREVDDKIWLVGDAQSALWTSERVC